MGIGVPLEVLAGAAVAAGGLAHAGLVVAAFVFFWALVMGL